MSYRKKHSPPKPEQQTIFPPAEVEYSNPGSIRTLSTSRLTSGLPYQRPVEQKNVDKLVRNWNSRELYPVIVSFRDGKFNVVDGQNRIAAMRQMAGGGDVIVPCMIYTGMTYEQEAELYAKLDKGKRPLTPRQHTKALVESGSDARIMEINCLVEDVGFVANPLRLLLSVPLSTLTSFSAARRLPECSPCWPERGRVRPIPSKPPCFPAWPCLSRPMRRN